MHGGVSQYVQIQCVSESSHQGTSKFYKSFLEEARIHSTDNTVSTKSSLGVAKEISDQHLL